MGVLAAGGVADTKGGGGWEIKVIHTHPSPIHRPSVGGGANHRPTTTTRTQPGWISPHHPPLPSRSTRLVQLLRGKTTTAAAVLIAVVNHSGGGIMIMASRMRKGEGGGGRAARPSTTTTGVGNRGNERRGD